MKLFTLKELKNLDATALRKTGEVDEIYSRMAETVEEKRRLAEHRRRRRRLLAILSFVVMVVIPTIAAAIYYGFYAKDIYVTESRFIIRSQQTISAGKFSFLAGISSPSEKDSQAIVDYIKSVSIIDDLLNSSKINIYEIFSKGDFFSRFDTTLPKEEFVKYWRSMVRARYDGKSDAVVLKVRAFTPEDSLALSKEILKKSEEVVNKITDKARKRAVVFAEKDVKIAEERLLSILSKLSGLRAQSGIMDPNVSVKSSTALEQQMLVQLLSLKVKLETRKRLLGKNAPDLPALRSKIAALEKELKKIRSAGNTERKNKDFPQILKRFELLKTELNFAEKAYVRALTALETARIQADRNAKYLAVYIQPVLPQSATEPKRIHMVSMVALITFLTWMIVGLMFMGIRDHVF